MKARPDGDRHELVDCPYFTLHHWHGDKPVTVGRAGACRVVVAIQGSGTLAGEPFQIGDLVLLPASLGPVPVVPHGALRLLEIGLGEAA